MKFRAKLLSAVVHYGPSRMQFWAGNKAPPTLYDRQRGTGETRVVDG